MQIRVRADERPSLLISLTDCATIAAEVDWLRAQGHTKLAVWRHFLEHFVVDLDALSLIIAELFEPSSVDAQPVPEASRPAIELRVAA
jgi:hypothetical protein